MTDRKKSEAGPTLLSGGNPQIPKGEGRPGAGLRRCHAWVETRRWSTPRRRHREHGPQVHKAVKWNQPFYGFKDERWSCPSVATTEYVQLQFRGTSLDPIPPKASSTTRCAT